MLKTDGMVGTVFGRLAVIRRAPDNKHGQDMWECECSCGQIKVVSGYPMRTGRTVSCGCYGREMILNSQTRHGYTAGGNVSRTYACWAHMRARVYIKSDAGYKNYGGRGISICDRWSDFKNFLEDMGEMPEGLSIERLDNDGNYCKENCRWATRTRQGRNSRKAKLSMEKAREIRRDPRSIVDIASDYEVSYTTIWAVKNHKLWKENQPLFYEPQTTT